MKGINAVLLLWRVGAVMAVVPAGRCIVSGTWVVYLLLQRLSKGGRDKFLMGVNGVLP